jgi:hypothetical protein
MAETPIHKVKALRELAGVKAGEQAKVPAEAKAGAPVEVPDKAGADGLNKSTNELRSLHNH